MFEQGDRLAAILRQIERKEVSELSCFGRVRSMNFQCFKPRGRYYESPSRQRYFQAFTWLSVNTLALHGLPESPAQIWGALVLYDLVQRAGRMEQWIAFDRTLRSLIGVTESLGLADLGQMLADLDIDAVCQLRDPQDLAPIQAALAQLTLGHVSYTASAEQNPHLAENAQIFSFVPQRFMVDSWALHVLSYNNFGRVERYPSCLDVAFAVLGNDAIAPDLAAQLEINLGELTAVRGAIDSLPEETYWQQSMVTQWLAMLRKLSAPADDRHPPAMRTAAWACRLGEAQLASWTQLRHATVLYAQPEVLYAICEYPAALVELRPKFWRRFAEMVRGVKTCLLQMLPPPIRLTDAPQAAKASEPPIAIDDWMGMTQSPRSPQMVAENLQVLLDRFIAALQQLEHIAELQLDRLPLTSEQTQFLRDVIESESDYGGMRYTGWYSQLFYCAANDKRLGQGKEPVALVSDVCAAADLDGEEVWALHQALGKVDLLTIVADTGAGLMRFAGPVFSHYEFATEGDRWTDERWKTLLQQESQLPRPSYTETYRASVAKR